MAREIMVERDGQTARFTFKKVDRKALYGYRQRTPLDPEGNKCARGELSADGSLLIRSGMTAQGYFDDDGTWYRPTDLISLWPDGSEAEAKGSTLNVSQTLEAITASELLNMRIHGVYALDSQEIDAALRADLDAGKLFRFPFNYRAGYSLDMAVLVANPSGIYALIGRPIEPEWSDLENTVAPSFAEDDPFEDDLDFEMF